MEVETSNSSMVTSPSPSPSPGHAAGEAVATGVGDAVGRSLPATVRFTSCTTSPPPSSKAATGQVVVVAADTLAVLATAPGGQQPSGIALDGNGRLASASNFSGATVTVVDLNAQRRRAIIPVPFTTASDGLLGIAIVPATGRGYLASFYRSSARSLRVDVLRAIRQSFPFSNGALPEAVVTDAAGDLAYFAGHDADTGTGRLSVMRMEDDEVLATILVGRAPEALALAPDETLLYVANTGNNNVSVIDTIERRAVGVIRVGKAPMGIVAVAVPEGQCTEACDTPTPTPTGPPVGSCAGDCDSDQIVSVNELVAAIAIGLGRNPLTACPAADGDHDGIITVADMVGAVGRSLAGCGE
jgi:YVTN family beta-propeller protein